MIKLKPILLFLVLALLAVSCADPKREQQLNNREQALAKREAEFASKAAEYKSLLLMRDSLLTLKDSVITQTWPAGAAGTWNGKTICRESDCGDYVVGDVRADTWEFSSDSTGIFTRIINNGKLTRVYSASADSTEYRLHFQTDSSASRKVEINVSLKPVSNNVIKGTQTINVNNKCTASFSVELERASNP